MGGPGSRDRIGEFGDVEVIEAAAKQEVDRQAAATESSQYGDQRRNVLLSAQTAGVDEDLGVRRDPTTGSHGLPALAGTECVGVDAERDKGDSHARRPREVLLNIETGCGVDDHGVPHL